MIHGAANRQTVPRRTRTDLFPAIAPYSTGFLDVDGTHSLYWEQSGNPDGAPVLVLHGGPGAGATPLHRRFFDPNHYRIVIFDQRGAGRSHPQGCLENNTLRHLVADIEHLRVRLQIPRWHIFGGSWGSTLALSYAQEYPQHCRSLIMRGILLMEQEEVDWFIDGMKSVFPEAWDSFAAIVPEKKRGNLLEAYYALLTGKDEDAKLRAGIAWTLYESACSSLIPRHETIATEEQKKGAVALARIEAHYFRNEVIPARRSLLKNIDRIRSIPSVIVQGRYDIICPIRTAHRLHVAWPEADYVVVPEGGHSALDPAVRARLIEATENAKTIR